MFKQRMTAVCTIIPVFLFLEAAAFAAVVSHGFGGVSALLRIPDVVAIPLFFLFLGLCAGVLVKYFHECKGILSVSIGFSNLANSHINGQTQDEDGEPVQNLMFLTRDARAVVSGIHLFFCCEYFEAIKQFEKALETATGSDNIAFCHSWIAECYTALNKSTEALRAYEKVVRAAPADSRALISLAKCYYFMGKPDNVVHCCEEALKYGDSWVAQQLLGESALAREEYAAAAEYFEKAALLWTPRVLAGVNHDGVSSEDGTSENITLEASFDGELPRVGGNREPIRINTALALSSLLSGSDERSEQYLLRTRREWG